MFLELLVKKNIILKKSQEIELKKYTKTRSLSSIFGVDLKSNNVLIFYRDAKSRFLQKDALNLIKLSDEILNNLNVICKKKILFCTSEICSKSYTILKEKGWSVYASV